MERLKSTVRVNNAFNGSFYKYKTKDDRYFSFYLYFEEQKAKIVRALGKVKLSVDLKGPLEGLQVLDLTHIIAGPACICT
jgi:hypothetical protein